MPLIELITLVVLDYDPAVEFFVRVLGFDLVEDVPSLTNDGRPKRWVVVRPPGAVTGILLARADGAPQKAIVGEQFAGRVGFFLRVDDFDASFARMAAAGVEFVTQPRTEAYGRVAVFLDIAGNRWDLLGPRLPPMKPQDYSEANDWPGYFGAVLGKGPRETLVAALDGFAKEGFPGGLAVDVAAGEGRDTLELLSRGWQVVATDGHPDAFSFLWPRVPEAQRANLTAVVVTFADMDVPSCDLVNASFALPFCERENFSALWQKIVAAIRPGGRFAGQFFGDRDTWASMSGRTHHRKDEVLAMLDGFEIEMMFEEEKDDPPDVRHPKHWHIFHVAARKQE